MNGGVNEYGLAAGLEIAGAECEPEMQPGWEYFLEGLRFVSSSRFWGEARDRSSLESIGLCSAAMSEETRFESSFCLEMFVE